jgi:hypothetical protein
MLIKFSLELLSHYENDDLAVFFWSRENQIKYLLRNVRIECSELEISYFACIQQLLDGGLLEILSVVNSKLPLIRSCDLIEKVPQKKVLERVD